MYVGIDLGTSSVKLLLCDAQGSVQAEVTRDYAMAMPKSNWAEQNPQDWWKQTKEAMIKLSKLAKGQISGISFPDKCMVWLFSMRMIRSYDLQSYGVIKERIRNVSI